MVMTFLPLGIRKGAHRNCVQHRILLDTRKTSRALRASQEGTVAPSQFNGNALVRPTGGSMLQKASQNCAYKLTFRRLNDMFTDRSGIARHHGLCCTWWSPASIRLRNKQIWGSVSMQHQLLVRNSRMQHATPRWPV
jgi:hypothetical protein